MKSLILITLLVSSSRAFAIDPITGPTSVCSGATITLSDATTGGSWSSSNPAVASVDATGIVTGTLATATPGTVTITYSAGATYATSIITVNPTPVMTSPLTPPEICDSTVFNYIPMASVPGTTFTWMRPYYPGIVAPGGSGLGGVSEILDNSTNVPIGVKYLFTLTAYGCANDDTVTVIVNPTARLTTPTSDSICSGTLYTYLSLASFVGTTLNWTRATVPGISNAAGSGTGNISETLINTTSSAITVNYAYALTVGTCTAYDTVHVKVNACISGVAEVDIMDVDVYPNPNQGLFTVTIPEAMGNATTAITITDMMGRKVQEVQALANRKTTVHLDVPPGIYLLKACTSAGMFERKVVVK